MAALVDTKGVRERRKLRFGSLSEAVAEAERLARAEREGRLRRLGNWTPGQIFGHVAAWASYPFTGYPEGMRVPRLVRLVLPLALKRMLRNGLPPGVRIVRDGEGTLGTERVSTDEGLARLREAFERLDREEPPVANPAFGRLTHEQWKQLNLRHAELHLGFLTAEGGS